MCKTEVQRNIEVRCGLGHQHIQRSGSRLCHECLGRRFLLQQQGTDLALIEHWNGSSWSIVYSPIAPSSSDNALNSVKSIGKNNVWAVGYYIGVPFGPQLTLTEKYA